MLSFPRCFVALVLAAIWGVTAPASQAASIAPYITSSASASGTAGISFTYTITALNSATGYSSTALPGCLSLNAVTGVMSGVPTGSGTYSIRIFASNDAGLDYLDTTFSFVSKPNIKSALKATGTNGSGFSYQILADNAPTGYSVSGLPLGLTFNPSTGLVSGTPTATGSSNVILTAINPYGSGTASLALNILPPPPVITSTLSLTGTNSQRLSYQIGATNAPTGYSVNPLPSGMTVNAAGLLSGTPTKVGSAVSGTFSLVLTASNTGGKGTASLVLVLKPAVPVFSGSLVATGSIYKPFAYTVKPSNITVSLPTSYSSDALPDGLGLDAATGLISGTPTTPGNFPLTVTASNVSGTATASLLLKLLPPPPNITSDATASGTNGQPFSYQILTDDSPTFFSIVKGSLPRGVAINTSTGLISGTPTVTGTFAVTLGAKNPGGTGTAALVVTLQQPAPTFNGLSSGLLKVTGTNGAPFTYAPSFNNNPTSTLASGLPDGLSINGTTGRITGTPTVTGTFPVTLTAINSSGTGTATLILTLLPTPPAITSLLNATGTNGKPFSYQVVATGTATRYTATALPSGLSINGTTGLIAGTPTKSGTFAVILAAGNSGGTGTATLNLALAAAAPGVKTGTADPDYEQVVVNATVTANGLASSFLIEYGTSASYGSQTATLPAGSGTSSALVSATVTGLKPYTKYFYRAVAYSTSGTTYGLAASFKTDGGAPVLSPIALSDIGLGQVTPSDIVNPNGLDSSVWFDYRRLGARASVTGTSFIAASGSSSEVSVDLSSLQPHSTYKIRCIARNIAGTSVSPEATFRSPARLDWNRDGLGDLIVGSSSVGVGTITTLLSCSNGQVTGTAAGPVIPTGKAIAGAADFDQDGRLDLVIFEKTTRKISFLSGSSQWTKSVSSGTAAPSGYTVVAAADINLDGIPDLILQNNTKTAVWLMNGFTPYVQTSGVIPFVGPDLPLGFKIVAVDDMNGDGRPDLLLVNAALRKTAIMRLGSNLENSLAKFELPVLPDTDYVVTNAGLVDGPVLPKATIDANWQLIGADAYLSADQATTLRTGVDQVQWVLYNQTRRTFAFWVIKKNSGRSFETSFNGTLPGGMFPNGSLPSGTVPILIP